MFHFKTAYRFVPRPYITKILPNKGIWTGNTSVTVRGAHFIESPMLKCKFGNDIVDAVYRTETIVVCITPEVT